MTNHQQQNNPRPDRAEQVRTERRRKPGAVAHTGIQLGVDESKLDRTNYAYRLVNDANGRVQQLEAQDWDPAPEQALIGSTGEGTIQAKHAGHIEGKEFKAVLMRKPKWMHDEDQAAKQRPLDEMDQAIVRGQNHAASEPQLATGTYTPGGGNTLSRA
ncbi:MAG: hypothetical protein EOO81_09635 [Oxalobacteraceae bacterium]|nr:MAG: hypothetical protein EOO81_09635 [Oxalobacteraceae bacterium]